MRDGRRVKSEGLRIREAMVSIFGSTDVWELQYVRMSAELQPFTSMALA